MHRTKRRGATPAGDEPCPMTAALAAVGGKWNLIVLYWLALEPRRFHELREVMPSISQKVLTQTLRDLEANGLVLRESTGRAPTRVEYSLSRHGETLAPVVEAVRLWGHRHLAWGKARSKSEQGIPVSPVTQRRSQRSTKLQRAPLET